MQLFISFWLGFYFLCGYCWHGDIINRVNNSSSNCQKFERGSNYEDIVNRFQLWNVSFPSKDKYKVIFGTFEALRIVHANQNPTSCLSAKYLISGYHNGGFGSEIHVLGAQLGLAINLHRVFLLNPFIHPKVRWEVENAFCQNQKATNLECYYVALSPCTVFDALGPNAMEILRQASDNNFKGIHSNGLKSIALGGGDVPLLNNHEETTRTLIQKHKDDKALVVQVPGWLHGGIIPLSLRDVLACSSVNVSHHVYWWRAIAAAYIVRPNNETLTWLAENSNALISSDADSIHYLTSSGTPTLAMEDANRHVISMHVRRGDKAVEMKIVPLSAYIAAAEAIWRQIGALPSQSAITSERATTSQRGLFVSTEDSKTLEELAAYCLSTSLSTSSSRGLGINTNLKHNQPSSSSIGRNCVLLHTNVFNRTGMTAEQTTAARRVKKEVHAPHEYLSMVLNLQFSLRSSAWVCTLASNSCRLIDELRATIAGKAQHLFADLSEESCADMALSSPRPCFGLPGEGDRNFGWRL